MSPWLSAAIPPVTGSTLLASRLGALATTGCRPDSFCHPLTEQGSPGVQWPPDIPCCGYRSAQCPRLACALYAADLVSDREL